MAGGKNGSVTNAKDSTPPPKEESSLFNVTMLYLTILGLGVILGYSAFYLQFNERCVVLLQKAEDRYNTSKVEWQVKHQEAVSEKEQCLTPLNQLQGKLEAQSTIAEQYQTLKEKHEETLSELATLQESNKASAGNEAKLNAMIGKLKLDLERTNQKVVNAVQDGERVAKDLQTRLTSTMEKLAQKTMELTKTKGNQEGCTELESELETVETFVQNRAERMCRMEYGKGPFLLQFNVKFPDKEETESFQVQLASLSQMPHTVFVLMELIHLKIYHGTVIKSIEGGILEIGNPKDAPTDVSVKLLDRLVKYGYENPIAFREDSGAFTDEELTIGFVESGPTLAINTADNTKERGSDPSFGKVISGQDVLTRIQEANGSSVELVSVERVR